MRRSIIGCYSSELAVAVPHAGMAMSPGEACPIWWTAPRTVAPKPSAPLAADHWRRLYAAEVAPETERIIAKVLRDDPSFGATQGGHGHGRSAAGTQGGLSAVDLLVRRLDATGCADRGGRAPGDEVAATQLEGECSPGNFAPHWLGGRLTSKPTPRVLSYSTQTHGSPGAPTCGASGLSPPPSPSQSLAVWLGQRGGEDIAEWLPRGVRAMLASAAHGPALQELVSERFP